MKLALTFASILFASALLPRLASAAEKEEPPATTSAESKPRTRSASSQEDRERYMNLSEAAKEKFRDEMSQLREKMANASPEDRTALAKKVFDKVEAGDHTTKPQSADNAVAQQKPAGPVVQNEMPPVS